MLISKTNYYDDFKCIADKCPMSCCKGWQIVIDDRSMNKYLRTDADIFNRIYNSIDKSEYSFLQYNRKCAMLDDDELCSIQKELGEEYLCDTCRKYPRHVEEFENVREYSLSLSCPEAARIILNQKKFKIISHENEVVEYYDDFDLFLYDQLLDLREKMFVVFDNPKMMFMTKFNLVLQVAYDFQKYYDNEGLYALQQLLFYENKKGPFGYYIPSRTKANILDLMDSYKYLFEMEMLEDDWKAYVTQMGWFARSKSGPERLKKYLNDNSKKMLNLLRFFTFTYLCGAVYDGMIFSKVALAAYSTFWIAQLGCALKYDPKCKLSDEDTLYFATYRYAREIEHSENNIKKLEKIFMNIFDNEVNKNS